MSRWLIAALGLVLIAGGCIVAYPGESGRHLAGLAAIIAGLYCLIELMRSKRV
jgi:uncharacterized membrane protein